MSHSTTSPSARFPGLPAAAVPLALLVHDGGPAPVVRLAYAPGGREPRDAVLTAAAVVELAEDCRRGGPIGLAGLPPAAAEILTELAEGGHLGVLAALLTTAASRAGGGR